MSAPTSSSRPSSPPAPSAPSPPPAAAPAPAPASASADASQPAAPAAGQPSDRDLFTTLYSSSQLADRLAAATALNASLTSKLAIAHSDFLALQTSRAQSVAHLQRELIKKEQKIQEMAQDIKNAHTDNEALSASHAKAVESIRASHSSQLEALEARLASVQGKYETLERFAAEKSTLEAQLAQYQSALTEEKRSSVAFISDLERRSVLERDQLKGEMVRRLRETKLKLLSMTEEQLHSTTKRTMVENEQIARELSYQAQETERLIKMNDQLMAENKTLKREAQLRGEAANIMAKKTNFYHKLAVKLQAQLEKTPAHTQPGKAAPHDNANKNGLIAGSGGALPAITGASSNAPILCGQTAGAILSGRPSRTAADPRGSSSWSLPRSLGDYEGRGAANEKEKRHMELVKYLRQEIEILQNTLHQQQKLNQSQQSQSRPQSHSIQAQQAQQAQQEQEREQDEDEELEAKMEKYERDYDAAEAEKRERRSRREERKQAEPIS